LAIRATRKQRSENKNDAMCVVSLQLKKTISAWCCPFVNVGTSPERTEQSFPDGML